MKLKKIRSTQTHDIYETTPRQRAPYHDIVVIVSSDCVSSPDYGMDGLKVEGKGILSSQLSQKWAEIIDNPYGEDDITDIKFGWANEFADGGVFARQTVYTATIGPIALSMGALPENESREFQELLATPKYKNRSQVQHRLEMFPIDCIVRGYMSGSMWDAYNRGARKFCGVNLSEGFREASQLPEPIFTPRLRNDLAHVDISFYDMVGVIDSFLNNVKGNYDAPKIAHLIRDVSLYYYKRAAEYALKRGKIIIADTKFRFGIDPNTEHGDCIMLGGEILTPESSHYWRVDNYAPGEPQDSQIVSQEIYNQLFGIPKEFTDSELEDFTA